MAFIIHFDQATQNLLSTERQATSSIDSTSLSYPNGESRANAGIGNLSSISSTLSNYAGYMSGAKDSYLLLSNAAEGLSQIQEKLTNLRTIAVLGQGISITSDMREEFGATFNEYKQEILQVTNDTKYKGSKLLDGGVSNQSYVVGPDYSNTLNISIDGHTPEDLNILDVNIDSSYNSTKALTAIDDALRVVNANINNLSSIQTQLDTSLSENNIKFIKLPETKFKYGNLTSLETQNYSTELQSDRFKYISISNLKETTTNFNIVTDNQNFERNISVNPQQLVIYLYQKNNLDEDHSFSLKL